jgi:hypothetical protein
LHAVTKQQLDTGLAAKADSTHTHTAAQVTGVVKSVNGQAPDGAGNVTVTVSGGGGFTQGQADALYLRLSGGTITGALTVHQALHSDVSVTAPRLNITSTSGLAMPSVNELATYVGGRASFVAQIDGTCRVNANLTIGGDGLKPGGGPWSASSDKRIKRNVADYTIGLDDINDLRPVRYQYNGKFGSIESDQNYIGLIADEVLETRFADSVHEIEHVDPKTGVKTMVKSINGNAFTYALMNAVKELSARVIALETKLAAK